LAAARVPIAIVDVNVLAMQTLLVEAGTPLLQFPAVDH
jgi:hypothetical protein